MSGIPTSLLPPAGEDSRFEQDRIRRSVSVISKTASGSTFNDTFVNPHGYCLSSFKDGMLVIKGGSSKSTPATVAPSMTKLMSALQSVQLVISGTSTILNGEQVGMYFGAMCDLLGIAHTVFWAEDSTTFESIITIPLFLLSPIFGMEKIIVKSANDVSVRVVLSTIADFDYKEVTIIYDTFTLPMSVFEQVRTNYTGTLTPFEYPQYLGSLPVSSTSDTKSINRVINSKSVDRIVTVLGASTYSALSQTVQVDGNVVFHGKSLEIVDANTYAAANISSNPLAYKLIGSGLVTTVTQLALESGLEPETDSIRPGIANPSIIVSATAATAAAASIHVFAVQNSMLMFNGNHYVYVA